MWAIRSCADWQGHVGDAGFNGRHAQGKNRSPKKRGQSKSAANTAWVPSPTAATLHALHYHQVDVFAEQKVRAGQSRAERDRLLAIPLADQTYSAEEIATELDNNAQSILGYVVRWVFQPTAGQLAATWPAERSANPRKFCADGASG